MWCSNCQQDVPALGSPGGGLGLRCGKCNSELSPQPEQTTEHQGLAGPPARSNTVVSSNKSAPVALARHALLREDDWALEAEVRGVQRMVGSLKSRRAAVANQALKAPAESWRVGHGSHALPSAAEQSNDRLRAATDHAGQPKHALAWTILSLGLAAFSCGAVLLVWSVIAQRDDLWPVGMPVALVGQAGLILGLILQLDGLWSSTRNTAQVLNQLDGELKNVRQATTLLSSSHSGGAQSFYLHLAEGASPQLLLTDLKGQLDLLAQQMARQGKA